MEWIKEEYEELRKIRDIEKAKELQSLKDTLIGKTVEEASKLTSYDIKVIRNGRFTCDLVFNRLNVIVDENEIIIKINGIG